MSDSRRNSASTRRPPEDVWQDTVAGTTGALTIGLDLACHIASFMNVKGNGLYNLCVAYGPGGAAEIRRDYLLDNDLFIEYNLEMVSRSVLASSKEMLSEEFRSGLAVVDKCKRNIMTWMDVNDAWRERVTAEKMYRYQCHGHSRIPSKKPMSVFNNIAIAVEIGLLDVVRHLVEEMHVPVDSTDYIGFYRKVSGLRQLVALALVRGDVPVIEYLLSREDSLLRNPSLFTKKVSLVEVVDTAMESNHVGPECVKLCLDLTSVDVNTVFERIHTYPFIFIFLLSPGIGAGSNFFSDRLAVYAEKVRVLLELGADPFRNYSDDYNDRSCTAFRYTKNRLKELKEIEGYRHIWPLWEALIEKMEAMRTSE